MSFTVDGFADRVKKYQQQRMQYINKSENLMFKVSADVFYVSLVLTEKPAALKEDYITRGPSKQLLSKGTHLKDIFSMETKLSKHVSIVGPPGIGKSTITQKIVHSWAIGELWNDKYDFVFHLRCRDLSQLYKEKEINLRELLLNVGEKYTKPALKMIMQYIYKNIQKVLVVVDGLDELQEWCKAAKTMKFEIVEFSTTKSSVHNIIHNLITGKLLRGSDIIVTTRPMAQLEKIKMDRYIAIQGFDDESVRECLKDICENTDQYEPMITHLENNIPLYNMCVIPFFCVLYGITSREFLRDKKEIEINNKSQMLIRALRHLLGRREDNFHLFSSTISKRFVKHIKTLAKLAAECTLGETLKLIFESEDIKHHNIDVDDISYGGLLELNQVDSITDMSTRTNYSFIHFIVQEFLAAVHVCLFWKGDYVKLVSNVDSKSGKLDNVQLFMAGLLGDSHIGHEFLNSMVPNQTYTDRGRVFLRILGSPQQVSFRRLFFLMPSNKDMPRNFLSSLVPNQPYTDRGRDFLRKLGSEKFHKLSFLMPSNKNKPRNRLSLGSFRLKDSPVNQRPNDSLTKLQVLRCAHEGRMSDMLEDLKESVMSEDGRKLDLSSAGGLLPHHLASIGWFIHASQYVQELE